jgi:hypothetical protein
MAWARHRASLAVPVQPSPPGAYAGRNVNPGGAMTAPDARDQQVLNRPACALSASVLTRIAAKMLGKGSDQNTDALALIFSKPLVGLEPRTGGL